MGAFRLDGLDVHTTAYRTHEEEAIGGTASDLLNRAKQIDRGVLERKSTFPFSFARKGDWWWWWIVAPKRSAVICFCWMTPPGVIVKNRRYRLVRRVLAPD